MIEIIPKERLLLETDSPFGTIEAKSQYESLLIADNALNNIEIDSWSNFVLLLNQLKV